MKYILWLLEHGVKVYHQILLGFCIISGRLILRIILNRQLLKILGQKKNFRSKKYKLMTYLKHNKTAYQVEWCILFKKKKKLGKWHINFKIF